jgi:hypothetical protein
MTHKLGAREIAREYFPDADEPTLEHIIWGLTGFPHTTNNTESCAMQLDLWNTVNAGAGYGAEFSGCRQYRYGLWRVWDINKPRVMFIGLNPSTADETADDPTIRRCINFAKLWGYGGLYMTNLFAFRATNPKVMMAWREPVGVDNDEALIRYRDKSALIIAAWGACELAIDRGGVVAQLLGTDLHCLGRTQSGAPRHPLYVKADTPPSLFFKAN